MKQIFTSFFLGLSLIASTQNVANFEALTLAPDTFWNGSDLSASGFDNGGLYFPTNYNSAANFWEGGFAYTNLKDSTTAGFGNLYSSRAAKGANNSEKYAVAYGNGYFKIAQSLGFSITDLKMYISNGTFAYNSMKDGDVFAKKFGGETGNDSDFFYLTFRGFLNGIPSGNAVDYYLADFRFQNNTLDYIQAGWAEVNLGALGNVDSVTYEFASSDIGPFGINTPTQFCIDDVSYTTYINSIDKDLKNPYFKIFPNPSDGIIQIKLQEENTGIIKVLDATGRVLVSQKSADLVTSLNINNLPNGIYFIRLIENSSIYTNKLILSK